MVLKKKAAAGFGAAMATVFVSPQLQADLVDFSFIGPDNAVDANGTASVDQGDLAGAGIGEEFAFAFFNSTSGPGAGPGLESDGNIQFLIADSGESVSADAVFAGSTYFATGVTGEQFVAFTSGEGIGWFRIDFGSGADSTTTLLDGAFHAERDGKPFIVGQSASTAVPEPGALGGLALLALGAAGRRRRRK